jgi:hypothetical protein
MNWSRASDGNVWSLARTGGSNNPKLQGSVTDASGVTLAVTGGALALTASGAMSLTPTGNLTLNPTGNLSLTPTGTLTITPTGAFNLTATTLTLNPTSGAGLTLNDDTTGAGLQMVGASGHGTSVQWTDGNTGTQGWQTGVAVTTPKYFQLYDATNSVVALQVIPSASSSGRAIQAWGPVAAAQVDMTPDSGTFTITYTGMVGVTGTAVWARMGNLVTLFFPAATGTSNAATFTATGLPAAIHPTRTQAFPLATFCMEDGGFIGGGASAQFYASIASSGTVTFNNSLGWTASGTKGVAVAFTLYYLLN